MARIQTKKKDLAASTKQKQKPDNAPKKHRFKGNLEAGSNHASSSSNVKDTTSSKPSNEKESLRNAILSLGGDEEDFEFLKDVDSDTEVPTVNNIKNDAHLFKDLKSFMKNLDFSKARPSEEEEDDEVEEEEEEEEANEKPGQEEKRQINIPQIGPEPCLLIEPTPLWYNCTLSSLPSSSQPTSSVSPQLLSTKQAHAAELHANELKVYEQASSASAHKLATSASDAAFLQQVLANGTLSDRLSALTLMAQSSPMHNTRALDTLRSMGQKKGREESLKALRAIVDWWVGGGAPDRKLKYFADQPLAQPGVTDKHLLLWYFEDWLKKYFFTLLQALEALSLDPLPYIRMQAMSLIYTLLREKPEQEHNLLRLLVNKLGDSERPVASRASYHLLQLLQAHPSMKSVVIREISSLVLRPTRGASTATTANGATHLKFTDDTPKSKAQAKVEKKDLQQDHAKYYSTITLNQIMLVPTESDRAVAVQLIHLYFELFKEILGTPASTVSEDPENKVDHSRYGKEKKKKLEEKSGKGKEKEEPATEFTEVEDANSKLTSAILTGVNRALPFAKLSIEHVEFSRHIDTLFLICHKSTFNISLQAFRLIMQICQSLATNPSSSSSNTLQTSISDRYYRALYASLQDSRLNSSSKQAMYLNLLLKSLKMDTKPERVKAFVRRFVQLLVAAGSGGIEFVAGGLFLLGELFKTQPSIRELLSEPKQEANSPEDMYDPRKRDPQYAHAGATPIWEITPLLQHFHPTIRLHASQLLSGKELTANADLSLNTLSHFLDRFVYKNPKKLRPKGASAMQPGATATDGTSVRVMKGAQVDGVTTVNDESFWRKDEKDIPADQLFFHKYFSQKNEKERAKAEKIAKRKGTGKDDDEVEDDQEDSDLEEDEEDTTERKNQDGEEVDDEDSEEEAEIWKAMKATNPDLQPGGDDDIDDFSEDNEDSEDYSLDDDEGEEEEKEGADKADNKDGDEEDDESGLSMVEDSDAEDLIDLEDVDFPEGLISYPSDASSSDAEVDAENDDEEWSGFGGADDTTSKNKRKRKAGKGGKEQEEGKRKAKRRRALPTFATYEDYAKLIEDGPEDNI